MIIKDKTFLHSVEAKGDNLIFNHVQDVAPSMEMAAQIKEHSDNGWTKDRSMRQIGHFSESAFHQAMIENPEIMKDGRELFKFVMSEKARPYRTVTALDTGRSGQVIIK
jgi:hypothetical protein